MSGLTCHILAGLFYVLVDSLYLYYSDADFLKSSLIKAVGSTCPHWSEPFCAERNRLSAYTGNGGKSTVLSM